MRLEGFLLLFCSATLPQSAIAQQTSDGLRHVSPSSSVNVVERNGACVYGPIAKADAISLTIHPYQEAPVTIRRPDVIAVEQGDALLFTQSNSWINVEQAAAHVLPRETFALRLKYGKAVTGKPVQAKADSITVKHAFGKSEYKKDGIATVDYLRWRPESDRFDYYSQEAPALLFFDPEFYTRAMGLEGRMSVRLFDAQKPITDPIPNCPHK